jgi:hypothetical protein
MSPLVLNFLAMALNLGLCVWNTARGKYGWAALNCGCVIVSALMVCLLLDNLPP